MAITNEDLLVALSRLTRATSLILSHVETDAFDRFGVLERAAESLRGTSEYLKALEKEMETDDEG